MHSQCAPINLVQIVFQNCQPVTCQALENQHQLPIGMNPPSIGMNPPLFDFGQPPSFEEQHPYQMISSQDHYYEQQKFSLNRNSFQQPYEFMQPPTFEEQHPYQMISRQNYSNDQNHFALNRNSQKLPIGMNPLPVKMNPSFEFGQTPSFEEQPIIFDQMLHDTQPQLQLYNNRNSIQISDNNYQPMQFHQYQQEINQQVIDKTVLYMPNSYWIKNYYNLDPKNYPNYGLSTNSLFTSPNLTGNNPLVFQSTNVPNVFQVKKINKKIIDTNSTFTPQELVTCFQNINGQEIQSTEQLAHYIHDISIEFKCRHIAKRTGPTSTLQKFYCHHHNSEIKCGACVIYYVTYKSDKLIAYLEKIITEHNHSIGLVTTKKDRNSLPYSQRSRIQIATEDCQTAQRIKIKESLTCSKDVLYGARRRVLKEMRDEEIANLLNVLCDFDNWKNDIFIDDDCKLRFLYSIHERIAVCNYSRDICILDDTSCTNYYGLPLLVLIVEDENRKNQILSFTLMEDRTKPSFINYLTHVKQYLGEIRLFISDRNKTQISAIETVWPNAIIIYCTKHISRNIRTNAGKEMEKKFIDMLNGRKTEEELIKDFNTYILFNPSSNGAGTLRELLDCKDRWLPSITSKYLISENETTNRVEGFFGNYKNLNEHKLKPLAEVVKSLYLCAESSFICSRNIPQVIIKDHLISKEEAIHIGKCALDIINEEYNTVKNKILTAQYNDECCKIHKHYGLPCRHMMLKRMKENKVPLLSIDDIPLRWRHDYNMNIINNTPNTVMLKKIKQMKNNDWTYKACIDKFERYFSEARKSKGIQEILMNCLNELKQKENETNNSFFIRPPNNLLISGAPFVHPSNNVDKPGARKTKRKYTKKSNENSNPNTNPNVFY